MVDDLQAVGDLVIGRDPFQLAALEHHLAGAGALGSAAGPALWEGRLQSPPRTFGAIEVACLDLVGKALGRPVCDLLGGRVRDRVPFSAYLFYKHRGAGGALASRSIRRPPAGPLPCSARRSTRHRWSSRRRRWSQAFGFKSLKLKAGVLPPEEEVRTIRLLREAFGPDMPLRIDPNAAWSVETSLRWAQGARRAAGVLRRSDRRQGRHGRRRARLQPAAGHQYVLRQLRRPARTIALGSV